MPSSARAVTVVIGNGETVISTVRLVLAWVGAVLMVVSGTIHSLVGWPALRQTLSATTPAAVVDGLAVPWHFAGVAMIVFGVLAASDVQQARRARRSPRAATIIGAAYVLFAVAGAVAIKPDPTFAIFIVPGLLILLAPR
jgi:hypothetical protein